MVATQENFGPQVEALSDIDETALRQELLECGFSKQDIGSVSININHETAKVRLSMEYPETSANILNQRAFYSLGAKLVETGMNPVTPSVMQNVNSGLCMDIIEIELVQLRAWVLNLLRIRNLNKQA